MTCMKVQEKLDKPKPWVGMYSTAASVACSIAMAADVAVAFRTKRFWIPCNYFSLNALSLTLLSVAAKLPLDFSVVLGGVEDKLAQISSLALMPIAMAHFMTSLGCMKGTEMVANMVALSLLIFTIAGNLLMHLTLLHPYLHDINADDIDFYENVATAVFMLLVFVNSCSSAVMIRTAQKYVESKYHDKHRSIILCREEGKQGKLSTDQLKLFLKRSWVMAETGDHQFVIACSLTSVTTGVVCLFTVLIVLAMNIRLYVQLNLNNNVKLINSDYKWSTIGIHLSQCIGVILGSIVSLQRLFMAAQINSSRIRRRGLKHLLEVESYWTQLLVEWAESPLPFQIQHQKFRKLAYGAKRLLLKLFIVVQTLIVLVSKLLLLISQVFTKFKASNSNKSAGLESEVTPVHDMGDFAILLDDDEDFPVKTLNNICIEMDRLIQKGRKKKPKNLIKLLGKSRGFHGVREFESKDIPSLHLPELPHCWSLPVVTLTSIAIALVNITNQNSTDLLNGVREGLDVVNLIERTLDKTGALKSLSKAAEVVWITLDLEGKWLGNDINSKMIPGGQSCQHKLQEFSNEAKKIVLSFIKDSNDSILENPNNWQLRGIAANSMYRISETLMQDNQYRQWRDEQLFDRLSIMISDIFSACLTNLVHVISFKCYREDITERERSVHEAVILLGESEEILEIVQQQQLPSMDMEKAAYIDEWRSYMDLDIEDSFTPALQHQVL